MKKIFSVCIMLMLFVFAACSQGPDSKGKQSEVPSIVPGERMSMPQFALPSPDGNVVKSEALAGKVLLVTFFATWCPPCLEEIPTLIEMEKEYGGDDFAVVAFSVDYDEEKLVNKLIEKFGVNYQVIMADDEVAMGFGGVSGIPVSFIVDKKGKLRKKYVGYTEHDVFEVAIKEVLKEG